MPHFQGLLTKNGFKNSEISLALLESDEGKKPIIAFHVDGIIDFIHGHCLESYHPELVDG